MILYEEKIFHKWKKFSLIFLHCSEQNQIFLHSRFFSYTFSLYTEKPVKFKKAICSFIFLFFPVLKFFPSVHKYFSQVHSGVNCLSPPLKFLVSLEISKLVALGNLLPHEPEKNFTHSRKKFFSLQKEKNKQSTIKKRFLPTITHDLFTLPHVKDSFG